MLCQLICIQFVLFSKRIEVMMAAMFVLGCASSIRIPVGYNYMVEMVPVHLVPISGVPWMVLEAVIPLFCSLYFWKVDTDWMKYFMFGYSMQIFAFIASFIIPESPRFSLEVHRYEELK